MLDGMGRLGSIIAASQEKLQHVCEVNDTEHQTRVWYAFDLRLARVQLFDVLPRRSCGAIISYSVVKIKNTEGAAVESTADSAG